MRKLIFRGKTVDNGVWVEGFYVRLHDHKGNETHRIYTGYAETDCGDYYPDWFEVDPNTVSQYTGLKYKNGTRIFEGDVLANIDGICLVSWDEEKSAFVMRLYEYPYETLYLEEMWDDSEIIGNIHDNPELLEDT